MKFEIYDIQIMPFIEMATWYKKDGTPFKKKIPEAHFNSSFKIKVFDTLGLGSYVVDEFGQRFVCVRGENINEPICYFYPISQYSGRDNLRLSKTLKETE